MGKVSSLFALGGPVLQHLWYLAVYHTRLELWREAYLGLCDVYPDDDGLYGHQRTLRSDAGRHDG